MSELGKKFRENENWEEQVDGSTLEKRRDQRAEILERFLGELDEEDRQGVMGTVNQYSKATGVQVVPAKDSLLDNQKKVKQLEEIGVFTDLPPVVKRSPQERIESLTNRLVSAPREQQDAIINEIAGEYFKAGAPVSRDALRTVAAQLLNQAERRK